MPFDGTTQKPEVIILDRMRELLATPDRWFQSNFSNREETAFCLIGACNFVTGGIPWKLSGGDASLKALGALANSLPRRSGGIDDFNDAPTTRHSDILALIDAARERIINETTL